MHRIRAITFDLDDTLWAIDPVIRRAEERLWAWLAEYFPRIPQQYSLDEAYALRQAAMVEHAERAHDFRFLRRTVLGHMAAAAGYSPDLVDPAFEIFDRERNEVELYADVVPALEALGRDFALVAVTNGNANLERIGLRRYFLDVVTAAEVGAAKPAPRIFEEAVTRAGVAAGQALHVGDHPEIDIVGARQAGLRTAWVNRNGNGWPAHIDPPDAVVSSLTELAAVLESAVDE